MSLDIAFEVPTWDKIYDMLLNLAEKIMNDKFKPEIIVGISRGGWPPARVMLDLLGDAKLANVSVEFYRGIADAIDEPILTQPVSIPVEGCNVLLFDDVADTGKSLRLAKNHLQSKRARIVKTATIYYKPWSILVPDYYEEKTRSWIVFPWERKETIRCLIENCRKEGISIEKAKNRLADGGMERRLIDRFINEVIKEEHG
ncbi:phosphoribosyltransferase [Candidatus Bathyarchaeota archaeon]|nr:phosphoribosyltransferase [Candidatus Bathyarchaeota archaeon]